MADIKFSQFTNQTDYTNVTDIVGYDGASNVRITPSNFISSWNEQQSTIAFSSTGAGATTTIDIGKVGNTSTGIDLKTGTTGAYQINGSDAISFDGSVYNVADGQIELEPFPGANETRLKNDALNLGDGTSIAHEFNINAFNSQTINLANEIFVKKLNAGADANLFQIGSDKEITWLDSSGTLTLFEDIIFTKNGASSTGLPNTVSSMSVGTGGAATKAAIEVEGFINYDIGVSFDYFLFTGAGGPFLNFAGVGGFDISYYGEGRFLGSGIHIFSDERIKKDISVSDSKEDLETISKIEISNYKHINQAHGDKVHKKVIAQQVIKHYPEAVSISKDVVPCIYEKSSIKDGIIKISVDSCGSDTCCKLDDKIKLIYPDGSKELVNIIESDGDSIKVDSDKSGEVFVYGKEVDDYHSVDYDALAMLNISATQELYKIIKELKQEIKQLKQNNN